MKTRLKFQFTFLSALCLILFTACKPTPAKLYEYSGITFICPAGWKITEDTHEELAHFVYMKKSGYSESGFIAVTWIDGDINWESYLEDIKEYFNGKAALKDLFFSIASDTIFNGYDALTANYTFNMSIMPHRGKIIILGDEEKIITVLMQEATEDTQKNKQGFAAFAESFSFK